ncbi:MAG: hypothetical protein JWO69_1611 [Thermoleophilia bacterium]|jgi:hypothetical protein|nr:hypothetical protein [Thermoleophilia bacterium]
MREVTNIRGHRIRWSLLAARGALVGVFGAVAMLVIAMATFPLFSDDGDVWSFLKIVSGAVLGGEAASPITGFEATPVLVGLIVHFALGAFVGLTYALLIAMFDLEGWTPVALFGLLYGAMVFVWSAVFIGAGFGPADATAIPPVSMFFGNIAFGLTAGVLLATWADDGDLDQEEAKVGVFEQRSNGMGTRHP